METDLWNVHWLCSALYARHSHADYFTYTDINFFPQAGTVTCFVQTANQSNPCRKERELRPVSIASTVSSFLR